MTREEAVNALDALTGEDPEEDHARADSILLALAGDEVIAAYKRLCDERAKWWATA